MRIIVFGLGHVGATAAACLAEAGHEVHGVDVDPEAVAAVAEGRALARERGLRRLLRRHRATGRLTAATSAGERLAAADLALVCVATPQGPAGGLDLGAVTALTRELGGAVRRRTQGEPLLLVYRSTLPPGATQGLLLPLLAEAAGQGPGERYEVAYNPEFLRQGSAVADFQHPARIVLGERHPGVTRRLGGLYAGFAAPVLEVSFVVAEMAKLVDNGWHALKVAFANEVGRAALAAGVEPGAVMAVLIADTGRNLGLSYLQPGGPFGGSCLAKDLAALVADAREAGLALPVLEGVAPSNRHHLGWLAGRVGAQVPPPGPILQVGLSYKPGTDDLRGSPLLELAQTLAASGYELVLHDPDLAPARLDAICRRLKATARPTREAALAAAAEVPLVLLGKTVPGLPERLPPGVRVLELAGLRGAWGLEPVALTRG